MRSVTIICWLFSGRSFLLDTVWSPDEVLRLTGDGSVNQDVSRMVGVVCFVYENSWMTKVLEECTFGTVEGESNIDQSS